MSRSRKNPRLCRVKQIIPSEYVKELLVNSSINASSTQAIVKGTSIDIRKNSDDNTSLIQRDIRRVESVLEKVFYISLILIVISCITLCIC